MRTLLALFALVLIAACPRSSTTTSGSASAEPTPPPRTTQQEERSEAPAESSPGRSAESAQVVIHAVIVPSQGNSARMPDGLMVVAKSDGALLVKGNPRALPTRGDWRTAAALGEETAAAKIVNQDVLLKVLAGGADTLHGGVRIRGDAPDDAKAQLEALGVTVLSTTEAGIEVNVLASRLDRLLGVVWVAQFEVSP